jgi:plasmid stability protein
MATLYVREVPDELYSALRELAITERRSVSAEALYLLKRAVEDEQQAQRRADERIAALERLRETRESVTVPPGYPDSVELLREDRAR